MASPIWWLAGAMAMDDMALVSYHLVAWPTSFNWWQVTEVARSNRRVNPNTQAFFNPLLCHIY